MLTVTIQLFFALILMSLYTGGVATFLMMESLASRGELIASCGHMADTWSAISFVTDLVRIPVCSSVLFRFYGPGFYVRHKHWPGGASPCDQACARSLFRTCGILTLFDPIRKV